jgi:aspartate racemase
LISDPSFPDRTQALLQGQPEKLQQKLEETINLALAAGADSIILCCFTIHLVLPLLPSSLRRSLVSLVDVALAELKRRGERQLLACTIATRQLKLFEQHAQWPELAELIVYPDHTDQEFVHHEILYRLKSSAKLDIYAAKLKTVMDKYHLKSFFAGCSELHLLAPFFQGDSEDFRGYNCIDPLTIMAERIAAQDSLTDSHSKSLPISSIHSKSLSS